MSETPTQFPTITREFILARARSVVGRGAYKLGFGGFDPNAELPFASNLELCDCSGFVAFCIAEDRENSGIDGGWIETTAIVNDARGPQRMFEISDEGARAGDIIVYGDSVYRQSPQSAFHRHGHVGIVTLADSAGHPYKVIHCSKGNFGKFGHAIAETNAEGFLTSKALVVRPRKLVSA